MNRIWVLSTLAAGLWFLTACDQQPNAATTTTTTMKTGSVTIQRQVHASVLFEAEAGEAQKPVEIQSDPQASGGKCVLLPEGPNHQKINESGDITYRLKVEKSGDYILWVRAKWCCDCGNSLDISLDGTKIGTVEDSVHNKWHWVRLQSKVAEVKAGDHLALISIREDGASYDQILLTQDPEYRPTEAETPDAPGRTIGCGPALPAK